MIDLEKAVSFPLRLDEGNALRSETAFVPEVDIRTIEQMQPVLMEKVSRPPKCYYMYRNVCRLEDKALFAEHDLRYDITVLPPLRLGKEFNKTFGHFHAVKPGTNLTYTEVYGVLHGEAHYILQNEERFIVFKAKQGDKVVIPPNYGHVTINPGEETLVMANWLEKNFSSDYGAFKNNQGAMYFETEEGWLANQNYEKVLEREEGRPKNVPEFGLTDEPMYLTGINAPEKLDFLKNPDNYKEIFESLF